MYRPVSFLRISRYFSIPLAASNELRQSLRAPIVMSPFSRPLQAQVRLSTTMTEDRNTKAASPSSKMYVVSPTELISKQRLNRPVSPNLSIYSWKIMICGALHRNTAILMSGTMYLFGFSYLVLPFLGVPFGSAELVSWFGALPVAVKAMIKWIYGFSFSFHFAHGLRHLIWDTGAMFTNAQVLYTVYVALGIGALGATGLCFV